jgi:DNA polymerase III subunit delta'
MTFESVAEQHEAKRLLVAALADGPAHAYLLHGPPGVGKRATALAFAAELLGEHARVERRTHPDLYVLEPVGDQIRIDDIRTLRRDLHMRPYEASRRVYLLFDADTMNEDAADASRTTSGRCRRRFGHGASSCRSGGSPSSPYAPRSLRGRRTCRPTR